MIEFVLVKLNRLSTSLTLTYIPRIQNLTIEDIISKTKEEFPGWDFSIYSVEPEVFEEELMKVQSL